jgi:hypothetical protein
MAGAKQDSLYAKDRVGHVAFYSIEVGNKMSISLCNTKINICLLSAESEVNSI